MCAIELERLELEPWVCLVYFSNCIGLRSHPRSYLDASSDSKWGLRFRISQELLGESKTAVQRAHFREYGSQESFCSHWLRKGRNDLWEDFTRRVKGREAESLLPAATWVLILQGRRLCLKLWGCCHFFSTSNVLVLWGSSYTGFLVDLQQLGAERFLPVSGDEEILERRLGRWLGW